MAPKADTVTISVRFNKSNPVQGDVYKRLEALAKKNPDAQGVGSLISQICCAFIDAAEDHPSINAETAQFVSKHMDDFKAWMAARQGGLSRPTPQASPALQPSTATHDDAISLDLTQL
ncbi:MAG: hypothetical protein AAGB19_01140 [Cyanobacteria bacterium P01_F01_bin.3]